MPDNTTIMVCPHCSRDITVQVAEDIYRPADQPPSPPTACQLLLESDLGDPDYIEAYGSYEHDDWVIFDDLYAGRRVVYWAPLLPQPKRIPDGR